MNRFLFYMSIFSLVTTLFAVNSFAISSTAIVDSMPKKHGQKKPLPGKDSTKDTSLLKFALPLIGGYYTMDLGEIYIKDTVISVVKFPFKNISPHKVMYAAVANCWNDTGSFDIEESKMVSLKPNKTGYLQCRIYWARKKYWNSSTVQNRLFKVYADNGMVQEYKLCFKAIVKD
jgi:hypothetical protein